MLNTHSLSWETPCDKGKGGPGRCDWREVYRVSNTFREGKMTERSEDGSSRTQTWTFGSGGVETIARLATSRSF